MEFNIKPTLRFEDILFESSNQIPKSGKLVKIFEAQDVDEEAIEQTDQPTDQAPQAQEQPMDNPEFDDTSLLDDNTQGSSIASQGDAGANAGGGILPICTTTGKMLMGRRSDRVSEPGTWSVWGGRLDIATTNEINENNIKNKVQEVFEEMTKYNKFEDLIPSYVYKTKENAFEWHNFIGLVDEEFEPMHDWRVIEYKWMSMDEVRGMGRELLHFGLQLLFDNASDQIRPLLVPKPKEGDVEEAPQESTQQGEIPQEDVPQEAPQEGVEETQDIFGEPDEAVQQNTEETEGI